MGAPEVGDLGHKGGSAARRSPSAWPSPCACGSGHDVLGAGTAARPVAAVAPKRAKDPGARPDGLDLGSRNRARDRPLRPFRADQQARPPGVPGHLLNLRSGGIHRQRMSDPHHSESLPSRSRREAVWGWMP
jgi:hypothetical protein